MTVRRRISYEALLEVMEAHLHECAEARAETCTLWLALAELWERRKEEMDMRAGFTDEQLAEFDAMR